MPITLTCVVCVVWVVQLNIVERRWGWLGGGSSARTLVGYARATSDLALVATVHEVRVRADVQGLGVGRGLMRNVTREITRDDVYDIGLVTPHALHHFFEWVPVHSLSIATLTLALILTNACM